MSEPKKPEIVSMSPNVQDSAITKKELIELGTVMQEERLEAALLVAETERDAAREAWDKLNKDLHELHNTYADKWQKAEKSFKAVTDAVTAVTEFVGTPAEVISRPNGMVNNARIRTNSNTYIVQVYSHSKKNDKNATIIVDLTKQLVKHNKEYLAEYDKAKAIADEAKELLEGKIDTIRDLKNEIKDLPKLERKMRAYLTQAAMGNDPEAMKLVKELRELGVKGMPRLVDKKK